MWGPAALTVSDKSLHSRSQRRRSLESGAEGGIVVEGVAAEDVGAEDMATSDIAAEDRSEGGIVV